MKRELVEDSPKDPAGRSCQEILPRDPTHCKDPSAQILPRTFYRQNSRNSFREILRRTLLRIGKLHKQSLTLPEAFGQRGSTIISRKHGEGFFRWVHLICSHESHCKESLQGVIARSHCKESLQGVIARSHGKESLQGVIARSHCKESWQGVIARSHCKESLQGVLRVIASCKEPSASCKCTELSSSCKRKEPSARSQVQGAKCKEPSAWSQVQVASAWSQVQVASARSQVQLTCEELRYLVRAAV